MTHQQPETFGKHIGPRTAYVVNAENSPNGELTITVQCPYCHQPHQHTWPAEAERPHYQAPQQTKDRNMKTITVTTPDGKHDFTGNQIETKPAGGTLRIIIDGEHVASYRTWDSWVISTNEKGTK